jgi:membrane protease YdiL (CAAX protease family)
VRQCDAADFQRFLSLRLLFAFLLVKMLLVVFSGGWLAQLLVPFLLVIIAAVWGGRCLWSQVRALFQSPPDWGDGVCFVFFVVPVLLSATFYNEGSAESFTNWRLWLVSSSSLFSIVFAPIAEELFFRGWLLRQQRIRCAENHTLTVSDQLKIIYLNAFAFWLMHAPLEPKLWIDSLHEGSVPMSPGPFLLGLVTAALTLNLGHLRAAVLFHAIANSQGPLWWPLLKHDWVRQLFYQ